MASSRRSLSALAALAAVVLVSATLSLSSPALAVPPPTSDTTGNVVASVYCNVDAGLPNMDATFTWQRGTLSSETTTIRLSRDGEPLLTASVFPGTTSAPWNYIWYDAAESGSSTFAIYTQSGTFTSWDDAMLVKSLTITWDCTDPFSDVPATRAFAAEIAWLAGSGITSGFSDGTFRPLGTVNRDAMAAFLYRFAGRPSFTPPGTSPFIDISPSTPFYKEITWLASTGITGGFSDGTFRPQGTVNRDAMAAFLYRFAGRPDFTPPTVSPFSDISPSSPFYKEVTWLATTGVTGGFSDGTFRAGQAVNRDAMAAFLFRFDDKGLAAP